MQVHHQQMYAVRAVSTALSERFDLLVAETIRRQGAQPLEPTLYPGLRVGAWRRGLEHRTCHEGQILGAALYESRQFRNHEVAVDPPCAGGDVVEPSRVEAGRRDLFRQVRRIVIRVRTMGSGSLQHREVDFEALVGG
ncbi:MAG: hypothetical protein WAN26_11760 [Steroidobacteraceae bacterium]